MNLFQSLPWVGADCPHSKLTHFCWVWPALMYMLFDLYAHVFCIFNRYLLYIDDNFLCLITRGRLVSRQLSRQNAKIMLALQWKWRIHSSHFPRNLNWSHLSVTTIKPPPTAILSIASLYKSYKQSYASSGNFWGSFLAGFSTQMFDHLLWMRRSSAPETRSQNLSTCLVQIIKINCTFLSVCSFWKGSSP